MSKRTNYDLRVEATGCIDDIQELLPKISVVGDLDRAVLEFVLNRLICIESCLREMELGDE